MKSTVTSLASWKPNLVIQYVKKLSFEQEFLGDNTVAPLDSKQVKL